MSGYLVRVALFRISSKSVLQNKELKFAEEHSKVYLLNNKFFLYIDK